MGGWPRATKQVGEEGHEMSAESRYTPGWGNPLGPAFCRVYGRLSPVHGHNMEGASYR